jgi:hypothetical protein
VQQQQQQQPLAQQQQRRRQQQPWCSSCCFGAMLRARRRVPAPLRWRRRRQRLAPAGRLRAGGAGGSRAVQCPSPDDHLPPPLPPPPSPQGGVHYPAKPITVHAPQARSASPPRCRSGPSTPTAYRAPSPPRGAPAAPASGSPTARMLPLTTQQQQVGGGPGCRTRLLDPPGTARHPIRAVTGTPAPATGLPSDARCLPLIPRRAGARGAGRGDGRRRRHGQAG